MKEADAKPKDTKLAEGGRPPAFTRPGGAGVPPGTPGGANGGVLRVALERPQRQATDDQPLWVAIRQRTRAIGFENYHAFIDRVLCEQNPNTGVDEETRLANRVGRFDKLAGVRAYELLKLATQVFLLLECGVVIKEEDFSVNEESGRLGEPVTLADLQTRLATYLGDTPRLPYLNRIVTSALAEFQPTDSPFCEGIFRGRVLGSDAPCLLELIWSYWHEEGMQVQSINAVSLRFQNRLKASGTDPLRNLEIDPLRPLGNILWGYIQDEPNRLSVRRRAYEYEHEYGFPLYGKAVPSLVPADRRSQFVEGFHNLLYRATVFFKEDDDTTVIADGFALLQALREVHLTLAEGAHNQFGDLPWTARVEMLIEQWILARNEIRDFLQGRPMVPYAEAWMSQVDTMKRLQIWSDVTITHFHDLARIGEQIVLSIRYGDWVAVTDPQQASNWARYWRPEIQAYIHAYRSATGVDLTTEPVDAAAPSVHLRDRLAIQAKRP
jgi:hypothetical protein